MAQSKIEDRAAHVAIVPSRNVEGANSIDDDVMGLEVLPLDEALLRTYDTDCHLQPAVIDPLEEVQPRLNRPVLRSVRSADADVVLHSVFIDVDNADHKPWSPMLAEATLLSLLDEYGDGPLEHAGVYATRAGFRIVFRVDPPIPADLYRSTVGHPGDDKNPPGGLLGWLAGAIALPGQDIDASCNSPWRIYRAPRVLRDGNPTEGFMDLDGLA